MVNNNGSAAVNDNVNDNNNKVNNMTQEIIFAHSLIDFPLVFYTDNGGELRKEILLQKIKNQSRYVSQQRQNNNVDAHES